MPGEPRGRRQEGPGNRRGPAGNKDGQSSRPRRTGRPRDPDLLWLSGHPLAEDQNQQSAGADHEGDQAQNPCRRCLSRRSVLSQPGGSATTAHRRNNVVGQMLHEYAATLSTAAISNRSRRMMNVRKILDTTQAQLPWTVGGGLRLGYQLFASL